MEVPPGVKYVFQRLPVLIWPPASVNILAQLADARLGIQVPKWAVIFASLLSLPFALLLSILYHDYMNVRDASKRGAVMPLQVWDRWPGGLSLLAIGIKNFKNGYPGKI
jgi:hypothetical protein